MTWKHPGVRYSEYMEKYGKPYYGTNEEAMKAKQEEKRFKKRKYKPQQFAYALLAFRLKYKTLKYR